MEVSFINSPLKVLAQHFNYVDIFEDFDWVIVM